MLLLLLFSTLIRFTIILILTPTGEIVPGAGWDNRNKIRDQKNHNSHLFPIILLFVYNKMPQSLDYSLPISRNQKQKDFWDH